MMSTQLPAILYPEYEKQALEWTRLRANEGQVILKKEKALAEMAAAIDYIDGNQFPVRSRAISNIVDNRIRKVVLEMVAALTDVRPIWNYETVLEAYKDQAAILNKLARGWWRNSYADRKLRSALTYSAAGGSGYIALTWNPDLPGGGDLELIPYDPRDVIPIGPVYSESIQDWQGVILRQRLPAEQVKFMFPSKAAKLTQASTASWFSSESTSGKALGAITTVWSVLRGKSRTSEKVPSDSVDLIRVYLKDASVNTGDAPVMMGDPDSNYAYTVYPIGSSHPSDGHIVDRKEAMLYPRGRLMVMTPETIMHDGPNPYWHGQFPLIRVTLDPLPWSLLGTSMVTDMIPLQNALNETLRGAEDAIGQWVRRAVIADKRAMTPSNVAAIDTRKSGGKFLVNPTAGDSFKIVEGPQLPDFYMALLQFFRNEMDENSGVKEFKQLQQMKQDPNMDSMEKFSEALSPLLKGRARSLEISLAELAEQLKVCFFQYYTASRRMQILGESGLTLEDFDYDPSNLIPDFLPGDTTQERAQTHHRNFTFTVAPDSFLGVSHVLKKMLIMQLFRANGIDIYSLWQSMDFNNIGPIPGETLPDRMVAARKLGLQIGPTPSIVEAQEQLALAQVQAQLQQIEMATQQMQMQAQQAAMGALPGQLAPSMGGVSNSGVGSQGGRPPSGNAPPQMLLKDGGTRAVVSESGT